MHHCKRRHCLATFVKFWCLLPLVYRYIGNTVNCLPSNPFPFAKCTAVPLSVPCPTFCQCPAFPLPIQCLLANVPPSSCQWFDFPLPISCPPSTNVLPSLAPVLPFPCQIHVYMYCPVPANILPSRLPMSTLANVLLSSYALPLFQCSALPSLPSLPIQLLGPCNECMIRSNKNLLRCHKGQYNRKPNSCWNK